MTCQDYQIWMMGYIDGELDPEDFMLLENHLKECSLCRKELERFLALKEVTDTMNIKSPEDIFWDGYWAGIFNRMERGFGWILSSLGFLIFFLGGTHVFVTQFLIDSNVPLWTRIGGLVLSLGMIVLLVSVLRERLRARKMERYTQIRR